MKLLLIISVFIFCKYGLAKPSEEASIKLNINVNTDEGVDVGPLHKTILLHKNVGNERAVKDDVPNHNRNVSSKHESHSSVNQTLVSKNGIGPRYKVHKAKSRSLTEANEENFILGPIGTGFCLESKPIMDETTCREACRALGIQQAEILGYHRCYKDRREFCFQNGHHGSGARMICKKSELISGPKPMPKPKPEPEPKPSPKEGCTGGCCKDVDCKGDRICENKKCVFPNPFKPSLQVPGFPTHPLPIPAPIPGSK